MTYPLEVKKHTQYCNIFNVPCRNTKMGTLTDSLILDSLSQINKIYNYQCHIITRKDSRKDHQAQTVSL